MPECSTFVYHDINQKKNDQVVNCLCAVTMLFNLERDGFPRLDWFLQRYLYFFFDLADQKILTFPVGLKLTGLF